MHIQVRGINFTKPRHKFGWKFTSKHFQQHYLPPSPISALPFHPFVGFTSLIVSQSTLRMNTQTSIYTPLTPQYPHSLSIPYHSLPSTQRRVLLMIPYTHLSAGLLPIYTFSYRNASALLV